MALKESGEMYLETVYTLYKSRPHVRSVDIAEHMNFSRASVSRGVGILRDKGFIEMDKNGYLTLTEAGMAKAKSIRERHDVLLWLLLHLGVDKETANEDACRIEHVISDDTFECIKDYLQKDKQ